MNFIEPYYRGALTSLRFVDARKGRRRFGPDADARWDAFAGDPAILTHMDRADVLISDADVQWPGAFGARAVFGLRDVAESDAFGPAWPGLKSKLWQEVSEAPEPATTAELAQRLAAIWGVELDAVDLPVAGRDVWALRSPGAVAAAMDAFAGRPNWGRLVIVVTPAPRTWTGSAGWRRVLLLRQLAGVAGAILGEPTRFVEQVPPRALVLGPELTVDPDEPERAQDVAATPNHVDHGSEQCVDPDPGPMVWNDRCVLGMEARPGEDVLHHPASPAWVRVEESRREGASGHDGWSISLRLGAPEPFERLMFRRNEPKAAILEMAQRTLHAAVSGTLAIAAELATAGAQAPGPALCEPNGFLQVTLWDPDATSGPMISFGERGGCWGLNLSEPHAPRVCTLAWHDVDAKSGTCIAGEPKPMSAARPKLSRQISLF